MAKKVLIIRFSSIGDIVLTTPVVRCLKKQFNGELEIHYLTKSTYRSILEGNPYIDCLHSFDRSISEVIPNLKKESFDAIIDLHKNIRTFLVKLKLQKKSYSFNKLNIKKWLLVNFKLNILPKVHIVDRYLETIKQWNILNDGEGLDYFIPQKDEVSLESLPALFHSGYIGFAIGAKFSTKALPKEKIISICKKINKPILLLGGNEDNQLAEEIKTEIGDNIFVACGQYSINQSASLVKQAEKIITHDTGLMHIAAACKKEIICIWGNTVPDFGMHPYLPIKSNQPTSIQVADLKCRPCSKIGFAKCPKKHFNCMNKINEEQIVKLT